MFMILFSKINLFECMSIFIRVIKVLKKSSKSHIIIGSLVFTHVRKILPMHVSKDMQIFNCLTFLRNFSFEIYKLSTIYKIYKDWIHIQHSIPLIKLKEIPINFILLFVYSPQYIKQNNYTSLKKIQFTKKKSNSNTVKVRKRPATIFLNARIVRPLVEVDTCKYENIILRNFHSCICRPNYTICGRPIKISIITRSHGGSGFREVLKRATGGLSQSFSRVHPIQPMYPRVPNQTTRGYACYHSGEYQPAKQPANVKDIDVSGYHKLVFKTSCSNSDCESVNCADPSNTSVACPGGSPIQNQSNIPTDPACTTELVGNFTSTVPKGKNGGTVDQNQNYSNQAKIQSIVYVNPADRPTVLQTDIYVDLNVSTYAQNHHSIIQSITK